MRRYQYRLNDQNVSANAWATVTPLKYIETVPGETFGGTISVKALSGITAKVIHSRAYYDLYAFYCPIRLLWPEFPSFLAGREGEVSVPETTTLLPWNFENSFLGDDGATVENNGQEYGKNSAILRRMYYMIATTFFRGHRQATRDAIDSVEFVREGGHDNSTYGYHAHARPSTLDESWINSTDQQDIKVDVGNDGVSISDIRRAYSLDRYEKLRDYYGHRYTDVLRGYGVKADWGILQEPECIGISNNDFRFVQSRATDSNGLGVRKGYFEGEYKLKLRKTFTPEHGLIGVFAVARADVFNVTQGGHVLNTRNLKTPTSWYDPNTWDAYAGMTAPKKIIDSGSQRGDRASLPLGEHLRKGRNEIAIPEGFGLGHLPVFVKSMSSSMENQDKYLKAICNPPDDHFEEAQTVNVQTEDGTPRNQLGGYLTHFTEVRVTKRSPVKPAGKTTLQR